MENKEWNNVTNWKISQVLLLISERNKLLKQQCEKKKDFLKDYLLWLKSSWNGNTVHVKSEYIK